MTVRELRAALFTLKNQDAEVLYHDPLNNTQMKVESVWVQGQTEVGAVGEADNIGVDDIVPPDQAYLSWQIISRERPEEKA